MSQQTVVIKKGLGFPAILTLLFVVAKLFGVISWSWWWVFLPIWGPVAVFAAVGTVIFIAACLAACLK